MAYTVDLSTAAKRDLQSIGDDDLRGRLLLKANDLQAFPDVSGLKKMEGSDTLWRRRVGNWRITFDVMARKKAIVVYHIKQRKEVYR